MNNFYLRKLKFIKIFLCFLLITTFLMSSKKILAEKIEVIPKAYFILPEKANIKIKWISRPLEQRFEYNSNNTRFIANDNKFLILYEGKIILNLISGGFVKLNKPVKGFCFLKGDALIFYDDVSILYGEINTNKGSIPEINLLPLVNFPVKILNLFKGDGDELYANCYDERNKIFEIYQFDVNKKNLKKIAVSKDKIDCVTGKNKRIYVSSDKKIKELVKNDFILYYEHPREEILDIYYKENLGIFYRTKHGIGYIKDGHGVEFLQLEDPLVYPEDNQMYVFMPKNLGIFSIENIGDFKNYNYKIDKLIGIEKNF